MAAFQGQLESLFFRSVAGVGSFVFASGSLPKIWGAMETLRVWFGLFAGLLQVWLWIPISARVSSCPHLGQWIMEAEFDVCEGGYMMQLPAGAGDGSQ